jgi:hypothetical protein
MRVLVAQQLLDGADVPTGLWQKTGGRCGRWHRASAPAPTEVDAFYWTDWAPDFVNPRREEQGLDSL